METKFIKVIEFFQTPDYESNYDRCSDAEYICECCGRKLNPSTMKQIQMVETGHWTDEQDEIKDVIENGEPCGCHSQGFFDIGPKCYRNIMKMIHESNETLEVTLV